MTKTKSIPAILTLFAGAVASVIMYALHYPLKTMLWVLLGVLLLFYCIGCLIKLLFDSFEKANESEEEQEQLQEEGAVVEKEPALEEENTFGEEESGFDE